MKYLSLFGMASLVCALLMVAGPGKAKVKKTKVDISSSLATGKHIPDASVKVRERGGRAPLADPVETTPPSPKPLPMPYPNVGRTQ